MTPPDVGNLDGREAPRRQGDGVPRRQRSDLLVARHRGVVERGQGAQRQRIRPTSPASIAVPGMDHCGGGPATDQFDMLSALVAWVEQGLAPDRVVARARGAGNPGGANPDVPAAWCPTRTRPLCPYPQVARYNGSGSLEDAANFSCK